MTVSGLKKLEASYSKPIKIILRLIGHNTE